MIVWKTRIISMNFISDFLSNIKNIIGGRLTNYEKVIDEQIKEAIDDFGKEYPKAKNVSMRIQEFTTGALIIVIHGEA